MTTKIIVAPNDEAIANVSLARRFLSAINSKNEEAFLTTVSEDCVYELRTSPALKMRGTEQLKQALAGLIAAWPDYDFVTHSIHVDATQFVAEWTMTGTLAQPLPIGSRVAVPDGRAISFDGVDICPVSGGKVTGKISYVDATGWYEQLSFQTV